MTTARTSADLETSSTPRRTALVLSGGWITGFLFEIGVLAGLEAAFGAPLVEYFDLFVGTSAGAVAAALLANGARASEVHTALHEDLDSAFNFRPSDIYGMAGGSVPEGLTPSRPTKTGEMRMDRPMPLDAENAVRERYGAAARETDPALCCPVEYDARYLEVIPQAVLERDYGCGDPSRHLREGETVLDLGSGSGKAGFIASQIVGPRGRVIGVDMNGEMLELARRAAPVVADRLGYANVEFRRGRIQDLALDLDRVERWLRAHPVLDLGALSALEAEQARLRREAPLVPDASVDVVISNCVLNLVRESDKARLFREIHRVLRKGGRLAISDIVADEPVPEHLKADPTLWSGCISGAFEEQPFLRELEAAGFYGMAIAEWAEQPFAVVEGIEFRSITVTARKGLEGPCYEAKQAVIYRGPWKKVEDDDGHVLTRGERAAVCAKTFDILTTEPYARETIAVSPRQPVPPEERPLFDCTRTAPRHPRETKGLDFDLTQASSACAAGNGCCG